MKKTYKNVDYDWLIRPTGDPFVDAGGYALKEFSSAFPDDDILEIIMRAAGIYVERWNSKINPFFLNSKITQPAFKKEAKKVETKKYYEGLLNNKGGTIGCCRVTGQKTYVFPAGRDNSVLTGSGTFVNFHHGLQRGLMLSKEVLIRYFFLPLACELLQGRIALISSNSPNVARYFSQMVCKHNLDGIANNSSEGVLKTKVRNPSTALFRYADAIIYEYKGEFDDKNDSLVLYHFTNFGASPDLTIYQLPFQVLKFYNFVLKAKYRDSWNAFVNSHYVQDKTTLKDEDEEDIQYWRNTVYENLLNNKSITSLFLSYLRRKQTLDFAIIKIYETKVRNMKKETIEKIEQMADFIILSNDKKGIDNAIKKLDSVTSAYLLRRFVINDIVTKNYDEGNKDAIVTVEDYANYLFPDTDSWKETRDVLLIAIFERWHKKADRDSNH